MTVFLIPGNKRAAAEETSGCTERCQLDSVAGGSESEQGFGRQRELCADRSPSSCSSSTTSTQSLTKPLTEIKIRVDSPQFTSWTYLVQVLVSQTSVMSLSSYSEIITQSGEIMPTLCSRGDNCCTEAYVSHEDRASFHKLNAWMSLTAYVYFQFSVACITL